MGLTVTGDIGCYTLGAAAPLSSIDACLCMGASIGMAQGMELARGRDQAKKTVAVIGDSTFIHSGMTGLAEMAYNGGHGTVLILDNSTTGMTGHLNNLTNGKNIHGDPAPQIDLDTLCRALGVPDVKTVDPFDLKALKAAIKDALAFDGVSVIIARRPCALLSKATLRPIRLDPEKCRKCRACMRIGSPALVDRGDRIEVDSTLCTGCGLCAGLCAFGAIEKGE
jgi:indolepyruvate ferredoxin oxidoreductase alpha subunit